MHTTTLEQTFNPLSACLIAASDNMTSSPTMNRHGVCASFIPRRGKQLSTIEKATKTRYRTSNPTFLQEA